MSAVAHEQERPMIHIGNITRPMTDEEWAQHRKDQAELAGVQRREHDEHARMEAFMADFTDAEREDLNADTIVEYVDRCAAMGGPRDVILDGVRWMAEQTRAGRDESDAAAQQSAAFEEALRRLDG
jgi:hypothetical protein